MIANIALFLVIILHFYVITVNMLAFLILPIVSFLILDVPWWYTLLLITPIESIIIYLSFNRSPCPLTHLENHYRKKLNMPQVHGFISYYLIKRKWRKTATNQNPTNLPPKLEENYER